MSRKPQSLDHEPIQGTGARLRRSTKRNNLESERQASAAWHKQLPPVFSGPKSPSVTTATAAPRRPYPRPYQPPVKASDSTRTRVGQTNRSSKGLKRGHSLTYAGVFLFTLVLYIRPAEFYPSPLTASIALIIGVMTLAVFVPSQLAAEGSFTARPREVNLLLLFCLTGLFSIPLAINPMEAWLEFSGTFIRCVAIFIVMINAVRTEFRLKGLLFLAVVVSCCLSFGALNDYRLGLLTVEGYRVGGVGQGIFGNSNDMAFYLATTLPIAIALGFERKGVLRRLLLACSALLMMAAIVVTYSRGAFLGCVVGIGFLSWKLAGKNKIAVVVLAVMAIVLLVAFAPGNYPIRILSIFVPSLDPVGSSSARQGELFRSIYVALRHPLFGVGMGNYAKEMSYSGLVTHNSYTQVASEMGMASLVIYILFLVHPLKKLREIAGELRESKSVNPHYYLVMGLQASLLTYLVSSFFASVAYLWYVYYLVAYAVCLRRMYEASQGAIPKQNQTGDPSVLH